LEAKVMEHSLVKDCGIVVNNEEVVVAASFKTSQNIIAKVTKKIMIF